MDVVLYVLAALLIAGTVVLWYSYSEEIGAWIKGGPIRPIPQETMSLSQRADKMLAAKNETLSHAAILQAELAKTHEDLNTATGKLVPPPSAVPLKQ